MIKLIDPKVGETIYDGAVGSAGFLCEAYDYMRSDDLSAWELKPFNQDILWPRKKGLAYIIGLINLILPASKHPTSSCQTASTKMLWTSKKPKGTTSSSQIHLWRKREEASPTKLPNKSMRLLIFPSAFHQKAQTCGRAAVVIKNTFLNRADNASISLRRELLKTCDLHTILDCPREHSRGLG